MLYTAIEQPAFQIWIYSVFSPYPGPPTLKIHNMKNYISLKHCLKKSVFSTLRPGYIATF